MNKEDLRKFTKALEFLEGLGIIANIEVRPSVNPFYIQDENIRYLTEEDLKRLATLNFIQEREFLLSYCAK